MALPQVQKVEQARPIDLSGQSKKVLEIKSHLSSVKSPIAKSGVFTKMLEALTQMENHLQKLRDFGAAKTDVKWNEKTGQYHATLDSNKMVPFSDTRVPEGATRAEPKLDTFAAMAKEGTGNGEMLDELKQINENTRRMISSGKSNVEDTMEAEAYKENQDREQAKRDKERSMTLKGMWDSIKEANKENWFVKHWKKIAVGLAVLFAPLDVLFDIWDALKGIVGWALDNPKSALVLGLGAYFGGKALLKFAGGWASKGAGLALDKVKGGIGKFFENRKALSMMKDQGLKPRGGPGLLSRTGGAIKTGASKAGGAIKTGAMKAGGAVKKGAGNIASASKGIFGSIVQKFGKAGKWIMKLGSKLIMPLVTTPVGWAILAGLAIGGLVYAFWDDIKAGLSKAFGFLTGAVDSLKEKFAAINIGSWMKALIGTLPDFIAKPLLGLFGGDKPVNTIGSANEGRVILTEEQKEMGRNAPGIEEKAKTEWSSFEKTDAGKEYLKTFKDPKTGKVGVTSSGSRKRARKAWEAQVASGGDTASIISKPPRTDFKVPDTGVTTTPLTSLGTKKEASQRVAERTLGKYRERKRGSKRGVELALKGPSGKHLWSKMNEKEKKRFKFAAQIAGVIPKTTNIVPDSPDDNLSASVSPSDKTGALSSIHTENTTLKSQQDSAGSFVNNSPTNVTNNNSPTTLVLPGTNNAQGGMSIGKLTE